ncbi:MAG: DNA gyrase inhibitor YacG [Gammaproteobacteria bacterium RBG_16_57_12]|nr:MAG: DNA gyrase inhibitor YacG [Gammaproteobacteria bacterium RBG_16_57_12]
MTPLTVKCPTCEKPVAWTSQQLWRPFCSERCKLIDLGEWADETHRISGESVPQPEDQPLYPE